MKHVSLSKTNINGLQISPFEEGESSTEHYIMYQDGSKENIDQHYVALFINGSIVKNARVTNKNNQFYIPLHIVAEQLGAQLKEQAESHEISLLDKGISMKLTAGGTTIVTNEKEVQLDSAPAIINNEWYVPISFASRVMGANVQYFNGEDTAQTHILVRLPHIMISRYADPTQAMSEEQAIRKVRQELVLAYEKKFGTYTPLAEGETVEASDDQTYLRKVITELKVTSQNDRYYVLPVVYDFWVDKYTGDVYTYYNGLEMNINKFDHSAEHALAFPG
ncbi:hypothetical protein D3C77_403310 [compost metagenome]